MRYKATFLAGFASGYVLGTRAGRERYEAIARTARGVWEIPVVQETAGVVQAQAAGVVSGAKSKVTDTIGEKLGRRSADTAPPAAATYPAGTSVGVAP